MAEIPAVYSRDELLQFYDQVHNHFPAYVKLVRDFIDLAEISETGVTDKLLSNPRSLESLGNFKGTKNPAIGDVHLFDLLRSKTLFPSNMHLADFAARILPNMTRTRFAKVSRADIAARIIEYLEDKEPARRQRLEQSMREAISEVGSKRPAKSKTETFFRQWEQIIRGSHI